MLHKTNMDKLKFAYESLKDPTMIYPTSDLTEDELGEYKKFSALIDLKCFLNVHAKRQAIVVLPLAITCLYLAYEMTSGLTWVVSLIVSCAFIAQFSSNLFLWFEDRKSASIFFALQEVILLSEGRQSNRDNPPSAESWNVFVRRILAFRDAIIKQNKSGN
jgi:hypothetical protein